MNIKTNFNCHALIVLVLVSLCFSCSKDSTKPSTPADTNPQLISVDKTSVISGEIIIITGKNFSNNYNGTSQIIAENAAKTDSVYLSILSRTSTQIVAVMTGTNGGAVGTYKLSYNSRPDATTDTVFQSTLKVTINAAAAGQFFVSSTFASSSVAVGATGSFGVKNGSTTAGDYTVKLVGYDYTTGVETEYAATVTEVVANGYGGTMDQVNFTVPNVASNEYVVKVTYSGSTLVAGWNSVFLVN